MRPLSTGELLDAAFGAVKRNFSALVMCTLVIVVPVAIVNTLISASASDDAFDFTTSTTLSEEDLGPLVAGSLATNLLTILATTLCTAACLRTVGGDVVGAPATAGQSLSYAAKRLLPLLWLTLLVALAVIAGLFLCLVGAIWFYVMFSMSTPALLFEEARGAKAMKRSRQLIEDHWWRVFGALIVGILIVVVLQAVLGGVVGGVLLVNSDSQLLNAVILTLINVVGFAMSLPFISALTAYIYFDLRVRKEGFDLQLLARGMGGESAVPGVTESGLPAPETPASTGFLPPQAPGG